MRQNHQMKVVVFFCLKCEYKHVQYKHLERISKYCTLLKVKFLFSSRMFQLCRWCCSCGWSERLVTSQHHARPPASATSSRSPTVQIQRDTITSVNEVAKELRDIKKVLTDISDTLKQFVNK